MAYKRFKRIIYLSLGIFTLFIFTLSHAQIKHTEKINQKYEELYRIYKVKESLGYDMTEAEKTLMSFRRAKKIGDNHLCLQLLEELETKLKQFSAPAAQDKEETTQTAILPDQDQTQTLLDNGPWPMYGQNPRHTCRSPYPGLTQRPRKPKWTYSSPGGKGISSPAAIGSNSKIYVGSYKNEKFAEDKSAGHSGTLSALYADGEKEWLHDSHTGNALASGVESCPLLTSDGKIIYGKADGHVYALNLKGDLLWDFSSDEAFTAEKSSAANEQIISSPVLGPDGTLYVCTAWTNIYTPLTREGLNKRPAEEIGEFDMTSGKIFRYGKVYAINTQNGAKKWTFDPPADSPPNKKTIWGSPAVGDDGTIYIAAHDNLYNGYLYALGADGTEKWRFPKNNNNREKIYGLVSSPSIAADGTIYVGSFAAKDKARLYAVNPEGTLKWEFTVGENRISAPAAIGPDGTIYVGTHNWAFDLFPHMSKQGRLYALKDLGNKAGLKWLFEVEYGIITPCAVDNEGNVFFGTKGDPLIRGDLGDFHLYALNNQGEKLWQYPLKGEVSSPPSIDKDGTIYVGVCEQDNKLYAFRPGQRQEEAEKDVVSANESDRSPAETKFCFGLEWARPGFDFAQAYKDLGAEWTKTFLISWEAIEPDAPLMGEHRYNWDYTDLLVREYQTAGFKNIVAQISARNFKWAGEELNQTPPFFTSATPATPPNDERNWAYYADFIKNFVERYDKDGDPHDMPGLLYPLKYIEIESEAQHPGYWQVASGDNKERITKYIRLLKTAYTAAKEANPDSKIIAAGFLFDDLFDEGPLNENTWETKSALIKTRYPAGDLRQEKAQNLKTDVAFINSVLKEGAFFDEIEFHLLNHYSGIAGTVQWLREKMRKNGYEKPIWIGDANSVLALPISGAAGEDDFAAKTGPTFETTNVFAAPIFSSGNELFEIIAHQTDKYGYTYKEVNQWYRSQQAKFLSKTLLIAMGLGLKGVNFGTWVDNAIFAQGQWEEKAAATKSRLFQGLAETKKETVSQRRPAFYTYKLIIDKLKGYTSVERLDLGPNIYAYKFTVNQKTIYALWYEGKAKLPGEEEITQIVKLPTNAATLKITHIITELGQSEPKTGITRTNSIMIDETPLLVEVIP